MLLHRGIGKSSRELSKEQKGKESSIYSSTIAVINLNLTAKVSHFPFLAELEPKVSILRLLKKICVLPTLYLDSNTRRNRYI